MILNDENKSPFREIEINQVPPIANPPPPCELSITPTKSIVFSGQENISIGEMIMFDKFFPVEYFLVKIEHEESSSSTRGQIIKFVWRIEKILKLLDLRSSQDRMQFPMFITSAKVSSQASILQTLRKDCGIICSYMCNEFPLELEVKFF